MADDDTVAANHSMPDPFALAIGLCQIAANAKAIEPALKRLRRSGRDIEKAQQKLAAVTAEAEQTNAELAEREAAIDAHEAAIAQREAEFEASLHEARDNLRGYYDSIAEADRHIRYRVFSHAGLLGGYNPQL
jgi:septal ring factor EnvC (AmiA/AmiB activator)